MADVKISDLPSAGTATTTNVLVLNQANTTTQIPVGTFLNGMGFYVGAGVPTITAPDGSIYRRTDGGSTSTLYWRAGGNWYTQMATPPNVRTVSAWQALFDGAWSGLSAAATTRSLSAAAGEQYNLAYQGFEGNLSMWRATGSTTYLDRCLTFTNNMISTARAANTFAQNVYADTYLGWVDTTHQEGSTNREWWLLDIFIWRHVCTMLRHMALNSTIMANSTYSTQYQTILTFTEQNIWNKWNSRSGAKYYDATHILGHWVLINMAIAALSGNPTSRTTAQTFVDEVTYTGMGSYAGSRAGKNYRSMMLTNPTFPTAYYWYFDPIGTGFIQDVGHGCTVMNVVAEQYDRGYVWTTADMAKFAATMSDVILLDQTAPITWPYFVDGTSGAFVGDGFGVIDGGYSMGRYSVAAQTLLETHSVGDQGQRYGCGCLGAAYLFGTQQP